MGLSMTRAPGWSNADRSTREFSFLRRAMGFGLSGVDEGDAPDGAGGGVHGGLPQLVGIHLPEALESGHRRDDALTAALQPRDGRLHLLLGVGVDGLRVAAPRDDLVQRWHGREQAAV